MTAAIGVWPYLWLGAAIALGCGGQLLLKAGTVDTADFAAQLLRPPTLVGLLLYGLSALAYMVALRRIPVSVAFPSVALSYAVVALMGHWLWQEPFGWPQIGGLVLISAGVILIHQH
ncbi:MAG: multidrug transporter [Alphaproteobacteria bacterium]|nr:multidrug transporter [Alphaproteobacteria bacterium]